MAAAVREKVGQCVQLDVDIHHPGTRDRRVEHVLAVQESGPRWLWLKKPNLQVCPVGITSDWLPLGTKLSWGQ